MALIVCPECRREVSDKATVCVNCGAPIAQQNPQQVNGVLYSQPQATPQTGLLCPRCSSSDIGSEVFQENLGATTVTKTNSKYKEKGHGCLWWLLFGWWWWIVDLFLWIFFFFPRLLIQLFKRKKYKGSSKSVSVTKNEIRYKTIFFCKRCGERWEK